MALVLVLLLFVLVSSPPRAASARDTISPGETLGGSDELVSSNGKYKLGFFQTGSESPGNASSYWYLGIWINRVPTMTPVWVANGDDPIADLTAAVLTISPDGNLVVLNPVAGSIIWSTQANITQRTTPWLRCQTEGTSCYRNRWIPLMFYGKASTTQRVVFSPAQS
jgi:hypothetical protein